LYHLSKTDILLYCQSSQRKHIGKLHQAGISDLKGLNGLIFLVNVFAGLELIPVSVRMTSHAQMSLWEHDVVIALESLTCVFR